MQKFWANSRILGLLCIFQLLVQPSRYGGVCLSAGGNYLFPSVYTHRLEHTRVFSLILSNKKETNIGARQMLMILR